MKRAKLIVTGEMERCCLHLSLKRLFPDIDFQTPAFSASFTSCRVTTAAPAPPRQGTPPKPSVNKLASSLIAYVEPGSQRAGHLDHVIVVDDLELCNQDQPGVVVTRFVQAVRAELDARGFNGDSRRRVEQKLRQRCSFHLFAPMTEAYFFGEPAALVRAQTKRSSRFEPGDTDIERFKVVDDAFLRVPERIRPWAKCDRDRHPKCYLDYLCTPSEDPLSESNQQHHYRETKQGVCALQELDWQAVLAHPKHGAFARSLIEDIADAIGVVSPAPGDSSPETSLKAEGILRNL